ncbi:hypothetical protein ACU80S_19480, partial [Pandoraea sputorum]
SFSLDLYDPLQGGQITPPLPADAAELHLAVARLLAARGFGSNTSVDVAKLLLAFGRYSTGEPGETLVALQSDAAYRHPTWRLAHSAVAAGNRSVYYYDFGQPLAKPARGTPHNPEVPFWFGTYDHAVYRPKF